MIIACWSVKGGSGTTVVSSALAVLLARGSPGTLLVDLAGEAPAVLGLPEARGPGLAEWLAEPAHPPDVLERLTVAVGGGLELLPAGAAEVVPAAGAGRALATELARRDAPVVVDAGTAPAGPAAELVDAADRSLLVLRPCYLALRRALAVARRPDGLVVVNEPGRALSSADIAEVLAVPLQAVVEHDPAVARAVDAGLLASRLPRLLERGLPERRMMPLPASLSIWTPTTLDDEVHRRVVLDPDDDVLAAATRHALAVDPLLHGEALATVVARATRVEGLGPLQPLVDDPGVTEVLVNAGRDVWIEREGRLERAPMSLDPATVAHLIERVVAPLGRRIDRSSPIVDARLPGGARVHAVVPPLAVDGPCLSIRRFAARSLPLSAFASPEVVTLLEDVVAAGANVLVSGPTSSGKTTLLNALAGRAARGERIITIEDAAELRLPGDHVVRLEARPPSPDGAGEVTIRALVRAALRMRPDRLVVGEVRGPEALDMLMAMSTGHDGSLATCHANGSLDALRRLEVMVLQGGDLPLPAIRDLVDAAIDVVVHVARGLGGRRRVVEVVEVRAAGADTGPRVRPLATATGPTGPRLERRRRAPGNPRSGS